MLLISWGGGGVSYLHHRAPTADIPYGGGCDCLPAVVQRDLSALLYSRLSTLDSRLGAGGGRVRPAREVLWGSLETMGGKVHKCRAPVCLGNGLS